MRFLVSEVTLQVLLLGLHERDYMVGMLVWWPGESEHEEGNGGCMLYLGEESVHWPRGGTYTGTSLRENIPPLEPPSVPRHSPDVRS